MSAPFFTIGHSTRSLAEFIGLLKESEIDMLVDVRSIPRSRTNPQFNLDTLPASLRAEGVAYVHMAALGGRRGKRNTDQASPNTYWTHPAFRNYADYALGDPFREALEELLDLGHARRCAIMCSKQCGGGVIGGLSRIICSREARPCCTSWARIRSGPRRLHRRLYRGPTAP